MKNTTANYHHVMELTPEQEKEMYLKCSKEELVSMLMENIKMVRAAYPLNVVYKQPKTCDCKRSRQSTMLCDGNCKYN